MAVVGLRPHVHQNSGETVRGGRRICADDVLGQIQLLGELHERVELFFPARVPRKVSNVSLFGGVSVLVAARTSAKLSHVKDESVQLEVHDGGQGDEAQAPDGILLGTAVPAKVLIVAFELFLPQELAQTVLYGFATLEDIGKHF